MKWEDIRSSRPAWAQENNQKREETLPLRHPNEERPALACLWGSIHLLFLLISQQSHKLTSSYNGHIVVTHDYKAMSFQKKQAFPLRLYSLASLACPRLRAFISKEGQGFSFILLPSLLKTSLAHKEKATKPSPTSPTRQKQSVSQIKIFPYNFLTLWHNPSNSLSPG